MGRIVIACYKPKPGMKDQLVKLTRHHVQRLRAEGLVTDREAVAMEAQDGTVVEVFEWKSEEAIEGAHSNARVTSGAIHDVVISAVTGSIYTLFTPLFFLLGLGSLIPMNLADWPWWCRAAAHLSYVAICLIGAQLLLQVLPWY